MRTLIRGYTVILFALAATAWAQTPIGGNPAQATSITSGTPIYFANSEGAATITLAYVFQAGTPSSVSITVQGCAPDGVTCVTLTPLSGANPYVTASSGIQQYPFGYSLLKVTPTFSGAALFIYKLGLIAKVGSGSSAPTQAQVNNVIAPCAFDSTGLNSAASGTCDMGDTKAVGVITGGRIRNSIVTAFDQYGPALFLSYNNGQFIQYAPSAGTDLKAWDTLNEYQTGTYKFRAVNDANTSAFTWMTVTRGAGATVNSVSFAEPLSSTGSVAAGGSSNPQFLYSAGWKSNWFTSVSQYGATDAGVFVGSGGTLNMVTAGAVAAMTDTSQNTTFYGTTTMPWQLGPTTAPTGTCNTSGTAPSGAWVFSRDGHATFCSSGTYVTKI